MEVRLLLGRIHAQVDQILNSKDNQWIQTLSVTIGVLHEQFTRERSHQAPLQDIGSLRYRKLTGNEKIDENSV
jgi:hypothetical protein